MDDELHHAIARVGSTRLGFDGERRVLEHRDLTGRPARHTATASGLRSLLQLLVLVEQQPPAAGEDALGHGVRLLLEELDTGRWQDLDALGATVRADLRGTLVLDADDLAGVRGPAC